MYQLQLLCKNLSTTKPNLNINILKNGPYVTCRDPHSCRPLLPSASFGISMPDHCAIASMTGPKYNPNPA